MVWRGASMGPRPAAPTSATTTPSAKAQRIVRNAGRLDRRRSAATATTTGVRDKVTAATPIARYIAAPNAESVS